MRSLITTKISNPIHIVLNLIVRRLLTQSSANARDYSEVRRNCYALYMVSLRKSCNYYLKSQLYNFQAKNLIPDIQIPYSHMVHERNATADFGLTHWHKFFNPRQLLTLVTYVEIINHVKLQLQAEYEPDKVEAIATYLSLILDRCVDLNSRLSNLIPGVISGARASAQHSLNLMWSYPEVSGSNKLWFLCYEAVASNYSKLCTLINAKPLPIDTQQHNKTVQIDSASADTL